MLESTNTMRARLQQRIVQQSHWIVCLDEAHRAVGEALLVATERLADRQQPPLAIDVWTVHLQDAHAPLEAGAIGTLTFLSIPRPALPLDVLQATLGMLGEAPQAEALMTTPILVPLCACSAPATLPLLGLVRAWLLDDPTVHFESEEDLRDGPPI